MCEGRLSGDRHLTGISPDGFCRLIARIANGADKAEKTEWLSRVSAQRLVPPGLREALGIELPYVTWRTAA